MQGSFNPFMNPGGAMMPMCPQVSGGQQMFMAMPYPHGAGVGGGGVPMMYTPTSGGAGMPTMVQPQMVPMMVPMMMMPQYFASGSDPTMAQSAGMMCFPSASGSGSILQSPPPAYHPAPSTSAGATSSILPAPSKGKQSTATNAAMLPIQKHPTATATTATEASPAPPHQPHVLNPNVMAYKPQPSATLADSRATMSMEGGTTTVPPADAFVCVLCGSLWDGRVPQTSERRPYFVRIARHVDRRLAKVLRGPSAATNAAAGGGWSTSDRQVVLILVNAMPDASILNECVWTAMRAAHYCSNCVVREVTLQPKAVSVQLKESINFPDDLVHILDDGRRVVLPHILLPASAAVRLAAELNARWRVDRYDLTTVHNLWVPCEHPAPSLNRDSDYAAVL